MEDRETLDSVDELRKRMGFLENLWGWNHVGFRVERDKAGQPYVVGMNRSSEVAFRVLSGCKCFSVLIHARTLEDFYFREDETGDSIPSTRRYRYKSVDRG